MSKTGQTLMFAKQLYAERAGTWWHGYVRRDRMSLLQLRPGRDNPYAVYEQLRAAGPMLPTRMGNWVTTSHAMCNRVLRDRRFGVRPLDGAGADSEPGDIDLSFLELNPPDHTRLRRLAAPAFGRKQMDGYRPRIEKTVHRLLDDAQRQGEFDLVSAVAAPLPIAVITDLLGIPDADADDFARYGALVGSALDGISSLRHARALMAADQEMTQLFERLFELRRREPRDDIVSQIVAAQGDTVEPAEMLPLCVLLLIAGFETTVNLIGNGTLALLGQREQWELLTEDPTRAPEAVEEVLRFDPPVQRTGRVALEPVEVDGHEVATGQWVIPLIGAANRDPQVYADPACFDIGRDNSTEHLAFSAGIHYCLGQPLARLEAAVAFGALAERMPGLHRVGRVKRRNATTIRGPLSLPLSASRAGG
ncbi:MAG: cytochrome P450 [Nocardioidaceae bacterium]